MEIHKRDSLRISARALLIGTAWPLMGSAQQEAPAAPRQDRNRLPSDPRVQQRTYRFNGSSEELPYAVFVPSAWSRGTRSPLIVAMHGLNGNPNSLMHGNLLELAEHGGHVVVAPMGYNPRGWYGIPWDLPAGEDTASARESAAAHDPANLRQLSEEDVLQVMRLAQTEFNADPQRIYLLGHSMGGADALYLASKYPSRWTGVAAIAPATKQMLPHMQSVIEKIHAPLIIVQGDADEAVLVTMTRQWNNALDSSRRTSRHGVGPAFRYPGLNVVEHRCITRRR